MKLLYLLIFFCAYQLPITAQQNFSKSLFYAAMAKDNIMEIDAQLSAIKKIDLPEKDAYEAVLLMKKAGLKTKAKEKLNLFKAGKFKMEAAIATYKNNAEYRFLRLIIQENAPNIVKYKNNLIEDGKFVESNFNSLSAIVQQAIKDYSKKSKILKIPSHN